MAVKFESAPGQCLDVTAVHQRGAAGERALLHPIVRRADPPAYQKNRSRPAQSLENACGMLVHAEVSVIESDDEAARRQCPTAIQPGNEIARVDCSETAVAQVKH